MAGVRLTDEIVAVGRKRVLDLREAVSFAPEVRPPSVPRYKVQMTDVFRYGTAIHDPEPLQPKEVLRSTPQDPALKTIPAARPRMTPVRRIFIIGQYPVIAAVAIGAAYSTSIGQWFIAAYAVYALIKRHDSRYTFGSAIFLIVTIPLFQTLGQSGIAQNTAVYVFELLVIGTIQAVWELRKVGDTAG